MTAGIPLTVISGHPAAGKSTLLAHVLSGPAPRVAAVLSGSAERVLASAGSNRVDSDSVQLPGGAVCCGLDGDVTTSLVRLTRQRGSWDQILLEVPTTSEARSAAGYAYLPGLRPGGVVMIVSAAWAAQQRRLSRNDGLRSASMVVMNRMDEVTERDAARARSWLRSYLAPLPILSATHGRVAAPLLLGIANPNPAEHAILACEGCDLPDIGRSYDGHDVRDSAIGDRSRAWNIDVSGPTELGIFRRWIERLPPGILRGHGFVKLGSEPHVRYRFELLGVHWGLQRDGSWPDRQSGYRITLVGLDDSIPVS